MRRVCPKGLRTRFPGRMPRNRGCPCTCSMVVSRRLGLWLCVRVGRRLGLRPPARANGGSKPRGLAYGLAYGPRASGPRGLAYGPRGLPGCCFFLWVVFSDHGSAVGSISEGFWAILGESVAHEELHEVYIGGLYVYGSPLCDVHDVFWVHSLPFDVHGAFLLRNLVTQSNDGDVTLKCKVAHGV